MVIDRGWVYAGDVEEKNGRILIHNAIWVFKWESVGFDGVLSNPKDSRVTLRPMNRTVDLPASSEIYRVPVDEDWGK